MSGQKEGDDNRRNQEGIQKDLMNALFSRQCVENIKEICSRLDTLNFGYSDVTNPLLYVCAIFWPEMIKFFVEAGADVNTRSKWGTNALTFIASNGNVDMIKYMLSRGAVVRKDDKQLLNWAEMSGSVETIKFVKSLLQNEESTKDNKFEQESLRYDLITSIKNGSDISLITSICDKLASLDFGTNHKTSPLLMICTSKHYRKAILKLFVKKGANINYQSSYGSTPIMYLAQWGNVKMVDYLIRRGADYTINQNDRYNLKYFAECSGSKLMVDYVKKLYEPKLSSEEQLQIELINAIKNDKGMDIIKECCSKLNTLNFGNEVTNPLLLVCNEEYFNPDLIMFFVENGADVNFRTENGLTALMLLAQFGALEMAKYLVAKGADKDMYTNNGISIVELAKKSGLREMAEFIEAKEPIIKKTEPKDPRHTQNLQRDLLMAIKNQEDIDVIKNICNQLETLNYGSDRYTSPLLMVCGTDYFNPCLIKLFVEMGADVNYKNLTFGTTPILYLAENGALEMVKYMITKGADPMAKKRKSDFGIVSAAKMSGVKEMVEFAQELVRDKLKVESKVEPKVDPIANEQKLQTELLNAIQNNSDIDIIKQICGKLQTLNFGTNHKTSPLLMVCTQDSYNPDLIKLFVESGADVNYKSGHLTTPIMYLAEFGALDMVKYLISKGAQHYKPDSWSPGLVVYAKKSGVKEMIDYALELNGVRTKEVMEIKTEISNIDDKQQSVELVEVVKPVQSTATIVEHNVPKVVAKPLVILPVITKPVVSDVPIVSEVNKSTIEPELDPIIENFIKPRVYHIDDNEIRENFIY